MAKYISNRQQNLKIGINSYTENKTVLEVTGKVGIGTTNATSKLYVVGDGYFTGVVTATTFYGDGSQLTGISASGGIAISTNTTNANQYIPYATSFGSTTGLGATTLLVFNPSSGNLGIGTTNPTSTLQIEGTVSVSSTTTSAEFIGGGSDLRNLSGTHLVSYASASDISNSALSIAGINTYTQVGILTGSFATNASDFFGYSVATSADGKTVIVGARSDEVGATADTGVVYVFDRVGNSFNQVGILTGSFANNVGDRFGVSLATSADGKTIIVGAENDELNIGNATTGLVYVFDRIGNSFNQVGILTGSATVSGEDFGTSVSISGDGKTIGVSDGWRSYIFERVGNTFNEVLLLNAIGQYNDKVLLDYQGKTIFISDSTNNTVYVLDRAGTSFNQVGILTGTYAVNPADQFGISLATSADGKTIVVGASTDEIGATTSTGVVYIFNRQGNTFNQVGILTGSFASQSTDLFGNAVSVSADGKTVIVGARNDEIGATTSTGIAYVFDQTRDTYVYSGPTGNIGIGTTNPTSKLYVVGDTYVTGVVTASSFSGNASSATYATSSGIATNLTSTSSVNTTGIITATSFTGSGANLTNLNASNLSSGIVPAARITETSALNIGGDLYVSGNISFGGTTTQLNTSQLTFSDPDLVLGVGTTSTFNPTDNTANHGGIAIASTEGSPLVNLNIAPAEVLPTTYKKFMWFKNNTAGLGTDAWLSNYAIGIGSTQFPTGTRLAVGDIQFTQNDLSIVRNIDASGVVTATAFYGDGSQLTGINASGGIAISTDITNQNQYINYATSFGSTTGLGATTLLVYNPSSGNLGIGTTNPTSKLTVDGDVSIYGGIIVGGTTGTSGQVLRSTGTGLEWGSGGGIQGTQGTQGLQGLQGLQGTQGLQGIRGTYTIYNQSTPPSSPLVGDYWVDNSDGTTYVYYDDGNSSQWVEFGPTPQKTYENFTFVNSNYTVQSIDSVILASGTINLNMPTSIGKSGYKYYVKNVGVGTITIIPYGSQTIDDYSNLTLNEKNSSIVLISDNSNWLIF